MKYLKNRISQPWCGGCSRTHFYILGIFSTFAMTCFFIFISSYNENLLISSLEVPGGFNSPISNNRDLKFNSESLEGEYISNVQTNVQNLPESPYILGGQGQKFLGNRTCARFPTLYDIHFSNLHWQVQRIGNITIFFYNAYLDTRKLLDATKPPVVRILIMAEQSSLRCPKLFCQLWFTDQSSPAVTSAKECRPIWYEPWGNRGRYVGFLLDCPLPKSLRTKAPKSVSIVEESCSNATNNLKVHNTVLSQVKSSSSKLKFGVCVKGLDLLEEGNTPARLTEWIELLGILGVDKIFFYEFAVHPAIKKVLDFYERQGKVRVTPISLPGVLPTEPRLRHLFMTNKKHVHDRRKAEVIPYNDCLYRNMNDFDFLAVLDTDEVVVPSGNIKQWGDLGELNTLDEIEATTFCFKNVYFLNDMGQTPELEEEFSKSNIPQHFHMLRHIYRSGSHTLAKKYIKCFHRTDLTLTVHNHLPLACAGGRGYGNCSVMHFDPDVAHMHHYRSTWYYWYQDYHDIDLSKNCSQYMQNSIRDTTLWKYKDELIRRVTVAQQGMK